MDKLLDTISNWAPNRWLMFGGFVAFFFFGSSGIGGLAPTPELAIAGMAFGGSLILLGAWYAREAARFAAQEKRQGRTERPTAPVSELSIDYAEQLRGSVTMDQLIPSNPPLQLDAQKTHGQLLETVCRLRIREAARDGSVVYYEAGHYIPRDVTVYGKT